MKRSKVVEIAKTVEWLIDQIGENSQNGQNDQYDQKSK